MKIKDAREINLLLIDQAKKLSEMSAEADELKDAAKMLYENAYEMSRGETTDARNEAFELMHHLDWMVSALGSASHRCLEAQGVINDSKGLRRLRA